MNICYSDEFLRFRAERHLTQTELANMLEISRTSVFNIEAQRTRPSKITYARFKILKEEGIK